MIWIENYKNHAIFANSMDKDCTHIVADPSGAIIETGIATLSKARARIEKRTNHD